MRLRWGWLFALGACFEPKPPSGAPCTASRECPAPLACDPATLTCVGGVDAAVDGELPPDAPATCWDAWLDRTVTLTPRQQVPLGTPQDFEADPSLADDDLTLYFSRGSSATVMRVYVTRRPTRLDAWGAVRVVGGLYADGVDSRVSVVGGAMILASTRTGGTGRSDLYAATITDDTAMAVQPLAPFNTPYNELDPELAGVDGLYFAQAPGGNDPQELRVARGSQVAVVPLTVTPAADPTLSPDERVLVISTVVTGATSTDLFYATRDSVDADFRVIGPVPGVNVGTQSEGDAELSSDGCELYFAATNAEGSQGTLPRDLFVSRVVR